MASDTQEALYKIFEALAGKTAVATEVDASDAATEPAAARAQAQSAAEFYPSALAGAVGAAVTAASAKDKDEGSTAASIAKTVFTSGFGIVPIVAGLFGLFGGGEEEPTPLVKYALPAKRSFEAAETASGLADAAYDQSGAPRAVEREASPAGSLPQINVTVQAMDARSFLDRSSDIAAAVREAMLNLNSINDVITDL